MTMPKFSSPFRGGALQRWFDEMERAWPDRFFARFPTFGEPWMPAVDIVEKEDALLVKADLPGVRQEDISITVEEGSLCIRAERKREEEKEEKGYRRMERSYGRYERVIRLPEGVSEDAIKANYRDGVLEITVPLPAEAPPPAKTIKIGE